MRKDLERSADGFPQGSGRSVYAMYRSSHRPRQFVILTTGRLKIRLWYWNNIIVR